MSHGEFAGPSADFGPTDTGDEPMRPPVVEERPSIDRPAGSPRAWMLGNLGLQDEAPQLTQENGEQ
jgi:hypothetical protein